MRLGRIEFFILVAIFKKPKPLTTFNLFTHLRMSQRKFFPSILTLIEKKLIEENEYEKFSITKLGIEQLLKNRRYKLLNFDKSWKNIPEDFIGPCVTEPVSYLPSRSKLDSRSFNKNNV